MAACDPIILSDISEDLFNQIKKDLSTAGFALTGTSGTVNGPYGIVFQYAWSEATKVLEIDILEKSFFVSCRQIQDQLYKAFNKYA
jgi:hypothetical protein